MERVYRDDSCEHCGDQSQEALVVRGCNFWTFREPILAANRSMFWSAAALQLAAAALLDPISLLSHSLSVRGARAFELLARHPRYLAIARFRAPYVHRISMVPCPEGEGPSASTHTRTVIPVSAPRSAYMPSGPSLRGGSHSAGWRAPRRVMHLPAGLLRDLPLLLSQRCRVVTAPSASGRSCRPHPAPVQPFPAARVSCRVALRNA